MQNARLKSVQSNYNRIKEGKIDPIGTKCPKSGVKIPNLQFFEIKIFCVFCFRHHGLVKFIVLFSKMYTPLCYSQIMPVICLKRMQV